MSVLAYSELLKRITGIDDHQLEEPFKILSQNNTTQSRCKIIKGLALYEPISIGNLLRKSELPRGGGSYLTVRKYFLSLEKAGLLEKYLLHNRAVWRFSKNGEHLRKYLLT
ncbi:hypothetical protein HYT55_00910 [Candidatus Woesearchaeota archaeon]|nr:hypothetical protein [Candidatus Woesearchaeota archaeon]